MPHAPRTAAPFEQAVVVAPEHLDDNDHVNNVVYLQWMNDVAVAHWRTVASPEAQATIAWVAVRHEIDYLGAAVLGDALTIRTWIGEAEGLRFIRHCEVWRTRDDRVLARARSQWVPVTPATGRPRRVPAEVRALFSSEARIDR